MALTEVFIAGIVPQELGSLKVQSAPRDGNAVPVRNVGFQEPGK
jgi:hypothetical protein